MFYNDVYYGMSVVWWFIWMVMLFWIFATPYDIPGQRNKKDSPIDLLKKRFAAGEISSEEFYHKKVIIENIESGETS